MSEFLECLLFLCVVVGMPAVMAFMAAVLGIVEVELKLKKEQRERDKDE